MSWDGGDTGWERAVSDGADGILQGVNDQDGLLAAPGKALYLLPGGGEGWRPALFPSMLG